MTDRTIEVDGAEVRVTDDPATSQTVVTGATVSGSRKENLGNYENVEPHASVRVEFRPAFTLADGGDEAIRERLKGLRTEVDGHLHESINRARDAGLYE